MVCFFAVQVIICFSAFVVSECFIINAFRENKVVHNISVANHTFISTQSLSSDGWSTVKRQSQQPYGAICFHPPVSKGTFAWFIYLFWAIFTSLTSHYQLGKCANLTVNTGDRKRKTSFRCEPGETSVFRRRKKKKPKKKKKVDSTTRKFAMEVWPRRFGSDVPSSGRCF